MAKADRSWPRPRHMAWQSPSLNYFSMVSKPSLLGLPTHLNSSTCIFPAVSTFPGFVAPAVPSLNMELTNKVQGFLQCPNADTSLNVGGALQNVNPSFQKNLLIFDRSGYKTRLFYGPTLPYVQSPTITATKFQSYDGNGKGQANIGQKHVTNYSSREESVKDHTVPEESEMHEDTDEINALLYSDDDSDEDDDDDDNCDEVMSTDRSPLATKRTYVIQEQFEDMKEEVASSDWPNKRLKLVDGDYNKSSPPVDSASLVIPNETSDCVSDAESKNSCGWTYSVDKTKVDNSVACDIKLKKDKIHESLRVLEGLIPGAKGKEPVFVIDRTIEYLKSLMAQTGALSVRHD